MKTGKWQKRIISLLTAVVIGVTGMSPCVVGAAETETASPVVTALKGPTAMGMAGLLDGDAYDVQIISAVDEIAPLLAKAETDIAAVPANLAAVLYQNLEGGVQVIAVNTLGVLYIVDRGAGIANVEDLKGRTIYASGKGATPEYALHYILTGNGLDPETDVTIEWKSEHAECLAALLADEEGVALLPQPFVTTAQMKEESIHVALDLNEEWDALQEGAESPSALLTGVAVVRTAYAEAHPEEVAAFLEAYQESVTFVQENPEAAAAVIGAADIVPEAVARKALPYCGITLLTGEEMKEKLSGYLQVLYEANPSSVGGALPDDGFYA